MGKQQIIMFEGEDCSGKTNIAGTLSKILEIPVYKPVGQELMRGNNLNLIRDKILEGLVVADILKQIGVSLIFDRYYPSEFAYSRALGRIFHEKELKEVDLAFSKLNTFIIICYKNNLDNYNDDIINKNYVLKIQKEYKSFADWTRCQKIFLNTTDQDLNREIKEILQAII